MSRDLSTILEALELPTRTVLVTLKAGLAAQYEALEAQLAELGAGTSLAGPSDEAQAIAEQMAELAKQMRDWQEPFVLRGLPPLVFSNLQARMPADPSGDRAGWQAWQCELIAACLAEPVATAEQVTQLAERMSAGQWRALYEGAVEVTNGAGRVPFSLLGSVLSQASAARSKQPAPSDSPEAGSSADSLDSEPSSNETNSAESLGG